MVHLPQPGNRRIRGSRASYAFDDELVADEPQWELSRRPRSGSTEASDRRRGGQTDSTLRGKDICRSRLAHASTMRSRATTATYISVAKVAYAPTAPQNGSRRCIAHVA